MTHLKLKLEEFLRLNVPEDLAQLTLLRACRNMEPL